MMFTVMSKGALHYTLNCLTCFTVTGFYYLRIIYNALIPCIYVMHVLSQYDELHCEWNRYNKSETAMDIMTLDSLMKWNCNDLWQNSGHLQIRKQIMNRAKQVTVFMITTLSKQLLHKMHNVLE